MSDIIPDKPSGGPAAGSVLPRVPRQGPPSHWPAAQVEYWPLNRLIPYARNARTHTAAQVKQIAASMREWRWTIAVLADVTGMRIPGHARVLAAELTRYPEVPVMLARGWSQAKKRDYVMDD